MTIAPNKAAWLAAALVAAAFTGGTVYFTNSSGMAPAIRETAPPHIAPVPVADATAKRAPVVVEVFTSQGCSSCPPADRLAARLARRPDVLVIQRPVTYWDRLGWKDTLGKPENTALQRAYARRGLAGRNGVYTPQAVVAGREGLVGSRAGPLHALLDRERRRDRPAIRLSRGADGAVRINVDRVDAGTARLLLVGLDRTETVRIGRGENGGRSVTYTNVWKGERPLAPIPDRVRSYTLAGSERDIAGADAYAVILREGMDGPVLAGRMLPPA